MIDCVVRLVINIFLYKVQNSYEGHYLVIQGVDYVIFRPISIFSLNKYCNTRMFNFIRGIFASPQLA